MPTSASTASTTTARSKDIDYGIDPWKIAIIDDRARRRGFRRDELPDVRQDLAPVIAAFRFDPAKSNGACERTVIISIIDNQITMILRTRARYQLVCADYATLAAREEQARIERREVPHEVDSDRRADVQAALASLWEKDRAVALALMEGENLHVMVKRTGRSRYDLERAVDRIREHFRACGLDAWAQD